MRFSLLLLISRDFTTAPHRFTVWHGRHCPNHCDRQTYNEVKVSGVTEVQYYSFPSRQRTNRCVRRFSFFSMQYVKKKAVKVFLSYWIITSRLGHVHALFKKNSVAQQFKHNVNIFYSENSTMPNIRGVLNSSSMSDYVLSRCLYLISNINIVIILWCYYKYISLPYPFKKNQVEIKK